jgi:KUP system potassium uptake protein
LTGETGEHRAQGRLWTIALAALGIVYGDIGTSPLYWMRECFGGEHAVPASPENVLGVVSLIFWALVVTISVKYLAVVMRADNRGEGGILALMALVRPAEGGASKARRRALVAIGLFGAALLYGDGMITPAISVLSAVEGVEVAAPKLLGPYVLPATIVILVGLFLFQRRGTQGLGAVFGPVLLVWFAVLALLGLHSILQTPGVLAALSPHHALGFFGRNGWGGFLVLGAVFLAVTGGEALYADMGHFGRRPIRITWSFVVLPALVINYLGQAALILREPAAARNPFYLLVPSWGLYPMIALATAATIIASQAVISGAFSLTRQAVQLGYCPRLRIDHTSGAVIGQIYVPSVNWALMLATIGLVLGFGSSSALAAAYGVAVATTMVITTLLFYVVARWLWGWRRLSAGALTAGFLVIDLSFFVANFLKVEQGGWFPLLVAGLVFAAMSTWNKGRRIVASRLEAAALPFELVQQDMLSGGLARVPGTAVFMTRRMEGAPGALLHNVKHNKVLHERVVLLTVFTEEVPRIPPRERVHVEELGGGFYRVTARYGFMEQPDVPEILARCRREGLAFEPLETTFFLGRQTLIPSRRAGMHAWQQKLFTFLYRNEQSATTYYGIPPNRVVELGAQVELAAAE